MKVVEVFAIGLTAVVCCTIGNAKEELLNRTCGSWRLRQKTSQKHLDLYMLSERVSSCRNQEIVLTTL